ncbi:MAG: hypothetical protein IJU24_06340 [Bacteroidaceae bacterium]|nr:hypothetical protein [Bacteroidaceae bacterium]
MKKTIYLLFALAAVLVSCDKSSDEPQELKIESADYCGDLSVEASSGLFTMDSIKVAFNATDKADSASVTLFQVKFAPRMPVSLDVTIPEITVTRTEKGGILTVDSVVPFALGTRYPNYTVKDFEGEIVDNEITFSLKFGSTPTSYRGLLIEEDDKEQ